MRNSRVAIVGGGIGGLVCGAYLARAGFKVVIFDKNRHLGGYCTTFNRGQFTFDAGPHSLGSCRKDGFLGRVLNELGLFETVSFRRSNPSDLIKTPKHEIRFWNSLERTIEELQRRFPKERKAIREFFNLTTESSVEKLFSRLAQNSFSDLLEEFFNDKELCSLLGVIIENLGETPVNASAWSSVLVIREHVLDGGYYPVGGMQRLVNSIASIIRDAGGELLTETRVINVVSKGGRVTGVKTQSGTYEAGIVISNADLYETARLLTTSESEMILGRIREMKPGQSAMVGYFGLNGPAAKELRDVGSYWLCRRNDIHGRRRYSLGGSRSRRKAIRRDVPILLCSPSNHEPSFAPEGMSTLYAFVNADWSDSYDGVTSNEGVALFLDAIKDVFPDVRRMIRTADIGLPSTFKKYNLCTSGSIRGWACTKSQTGMLPIRQNWPVDGLHYVGHWASRIGPGGVAMAILTGRNVAKLIEKRSMKRGVTSGELLYCSPLRHEPC